MIIKQNLDSAKPHRSRKSRREKRANQRQKLLAEFPLATGCHAGKPLRSVPRKYLRWLLDTGHMSEGDRWAVVHDFDKSGFEICQRLTKVSDWAEEQDRVAYRFQNDINVHDLGLRLVDIEKYDLAEESCVFKGRRNWNYDKFCTEEEEAFLRSDRRVELNAFTSPQFVEWLESKLSEHLRARLIPDDETLSDAYRRALVVAKINAAIEEATESAQEHAGEAAVPKTLRRMLKRKMKENSSVAWDRALYSIAESKLYPDDE